MCLITTVCVSFSPLGVCKSFSSCPSPAKDVYVVSPSTLGGCLSHTLDVCVCDWLLLGTSVPLSPHPSVPGVNVSLPLTPQCTGVLLSPYLLGVCAFPSSSWSLSLSPTSQLLPPSRCASLSPPPPAHLCLPPGRGEISTGLSVCVCVFLLSGYELGVLFSLLPLYVFLLLSLSPEIETLIYTYIHTYIQSPEIHVSQPLCV